jgi:hypothetical protein
VQKLHYGYRGPELGYFAFDIKVNGKFLDYAEFMDALCLEFGVPDVPMLASRVLQRRDDQEPSATARRTLNRRPEHPRGRGGQERHRVNHHDPKLGRVDPQVHLATITWNCPRKKPEMDEVADA